MATTWHTATEKRCPECGHPVFWKKAPATGTLPSTVVLFDCSPLNVPDLVASLNNHEVGKEADIQIAVAKYFMGARIVTTDTQLWSELALLANLDNLEVLHAVFNFWLHCQDALTEGFRNGDLITYLRKGIERHPRDGLLTKTGLSVLERIPLTEDNNADYMSLVPTVLAALARFPGWAGPACCDILLVLAGNPANHETLAKEALPGFFPPIKGVSTVLSFSFVNLVKILYRRIASSTATVRGVVDVLLTVMRGSIDEQFANAMVVLGKVLKHGATNPDNSPVLVVAVFSLMMILDGRVPSLPGVKAFAVGVTALARVSAENTEALTVAVPFLRDAILAPGGFLAPNPSRRLRDANNVVKAGLRALTTLVRQASPASGVAFAALRTAQEVLQTAPRSTAVALRAVFCISQSLRVPGVFDATRAVVPLQLDALPNDARVRVSATAILFRFLSGGDVPRQAMVDVLCQLVNVVGVPAFSGNPGLRNDAVVRDILGTNLQDAEVTMMCISYFANLASDPINNETCMALVPIFEEALKVHAQVVAVVMACASAFASLASIDANKTALMAQVPAMRTAATLFPRDVNTMIVCTRFFMHLSAQDANCVALMDEAPTMLAALEVEDVDVAVVRHCISFFTHLARQAEHRDAVKAVLPRLRTAVAPFLGTPTIPRDTLCEIEMTVEEVE